LFCFRDKAQLTEHRSTDTATLEVGFTKKVGFATEVDLSIDSSQGISQRCKNASALHESMIETVVNNYIYYRTGFATESPQVNGSEYKLLVPSKLRAGAIQSVHDQPTSSHGGTTSSMVKDVQNYIAKSVYASDQVSIAMPKSSFSRETDNSRYM